jgi:hypothetical protein
MKLVLMDDPIVSKIPSILAEPQSPTTLIGGFGRLALRASEMNEERKHPFSAILELANLTHCFDIFDLTKLVVELGLQADISKRALEEEKFGNLAYAQVWLLCVTAAVENDGKMQKGVTARSILLDAKAYLEKEPHASLVPKLQQDLLRCLVHVGDEPLKILRAMRKLTITDLTLMDGDLREILIDTTEEAERQLRAAGIYEDLSMTDATKVALSFTSRKPTTTLRNPSRLVMLEWGAYALSKGAQPWLSEKPYIGDPYDVVSGELEEVSRVGAFTDDSHREIVRTMATNAVTIGALWGMCGFPQVVPSHKLAAALMATDPPLSSDGVHMPWPAFVVVVPNGLIPDADRVSEVDCIGIATDGQNPPMVFLGRKNAGIVTVNPFGSLDEVFKCAADDAQGELLMRLLVGVILEMDLPSSRQLVRQRTSSKKVESGGNKKPSAWTFELKRDVKIDCRTWVGDYVRSEGKSPSVRSLTRGHQKRQPYGPKGALRKWIHVEPYWRGPLDGPVAVKSHRLGG